MLTVEIHNKAGMVAGVVAKSLMELPARDEYIARTNEGT